MMAATASRLLQAVSECIPRTSKDSLIVELDETCLQWKELDDAASSGLTNSSSWKSTLPAYFSIGPTQPTDHHQLHYNEVKSLIQSFQQCIQCSSLEHPRTANLKRYATSRNELQTDLLTIPELESSNLRFSDNSSRVLSSQKLIEVFTFQVINPRTEQIHQRIEILGNQSLAQLKSVIYCVHDVVSIPHESSSDHDGESWSDFFQIGSQTFFEHVPNKNYSISSASSGTANTSIQTLEFQSHIATLQMGSASILPQTPIVNVSKESFPKAKKNPRFAEAAALAQKLLLNKSTISSQPSSIAVASSVNTSSVDDTNQLQQTWQSITLDHLEFDIGQSLSYCHHNVCCKHSLQLLDRRFVQSSTADTCKFPREIFRLSFRRRACQICNLVNAQQIVYNDRLADSDPCLMCKSCYEMLHYDSCGQLLYSDFSVFPYLHDN